MKKIGFIGAGVMGKSMILNLMKKGFEVDVYARDKQKIEDILEAGAVFRESIQSCVDDKDVVITIVGYPKDVEEIYLSQKGILNSVKKDTYLIDMTTTSPNLIIDIYNIAKEKELKFLDAPVSGGEGGAKNATLSIMVGGDEEDFNACKDIFEALGTTFPHR